MAWTIVVTSLVLLLSGCVPLPSMIVVSPLYIIVVAIVVTVRSIYRLLKPALELTWRDLFRMIGKGVSVTVAAVGRAVGLVFARVKADPAAAFRAAALASGRLASRLLARLAKIVLLTALAITGYAIIYLIGCILLVTVELPFWLFLLIRYGIPGLYRRLTRVFTHGSSATAEPAQPGAPHPAKLGGAIKALEEGRKGLNAVIKNKLSLGFREKRLGSAPSADTDSQVINFWLREHEDQQERRLTTGETYTAFIQVGQPREANLATGERRIPRSIIPLEGLRSEWTIWSTTVRLAPVGGRDIRFNSAEIDGQKQWTASFSLVIPRHGDSATRVMRVTPLTSAAPRIDAIVRVKGDIYRELTVHLRAEPAPGNMGESEPDAGTEPRLTLVDDEFEIPAGLHDVGAGPDVPRFSDTAVAGGASPVGGAVPGASRVAGAVPGVPPVADGSTALGDVPEVLPIGDAAGAVGDEPARPPLADTHAVVCDEVVVSPARELAPRPAAPWQIPQRTLHVTLMPMMAQYSSDELRIGDFADWDPDLAGTEAVIAKARAALDEFRVRYQDHFDAVDIGDFLGAAELAEPSADWTKPGVPLDPSSAQAWDAVATSPELAKLAFWGHALYRAIFTQRSGMGDVLSYLKPGDRLDITWQKRGGPWLDHVPWVLMYGIELPPEGEPVDPTHFFGLRYRISYRAYSMAVPSRIVPASATRANLLYWGGQPNDQAWAESRRHAEQLARWEPLILPRAGEGKAELRRFLRSPWPTPVGLIYFYCRSVPGTGVDPMLRFGSTNGPADLLTLMDLGLSRIPDQPLVFVNACDSSVAAPYTPNGLERHFFERDCRAFIGTECKVPVSFAAKFATVFFGFLYGDRFGPMYAGEALTQARRFFWDRHRNLGGLFYSYVNDYFVLLSSDGQ